MGETCQQDEDKAFIKNYSKKFGKYSIGKMEVDGRIILKSNLKGKGYEGLEWI
jgi:hypothetical protein